MLLCRSLKSLRAWAGSPETPSLTWTPSTSFSFQDFLLLLSLLLVRTGLSLILPNPRTLSPGPSPLDTAHRRPRPSQHPSFASLLTMSSHGPSSSSSSRDNNANSNVVGTHYRVGKKIGEGSFGVIFEGPFASLLVACPASSSFCSSPVLPAFPFHSLSLLFFGILLR